MSESVQSRPVVLGEIPPDGDESTRRAAEVLGTLLKCLWKTIEQYDCGYADYDAAKDWLIAVGEAGEWPLFMDVFFEHAFERNMAAKTKAGPSAIQGPFYVPGSPMVGSAGEVPMRSEEPGEKLVVKGQVRSIDGTPIEGAVVDHWQADAEGFYSNFHPDPPAGNLRARFRTGADGGFEIHTTKPAPYMIPHDGPTGQLLEAAGWHPWRPAHLHYFVDADGFDRLTTQLFFTGDPWLGADVAGSDKEELIVDPQSADTGELEVNWDFVLQPGGTKRQGRSARG